MISLDISSAEPKVIKRNNAECQFGYRNSIFKINDGREIIIEATLELRPGAEHAIRSAIEEKIAYRNERHPMNYPNIGSIFKNTPVEKVPEPVLKQFGAKVKNDPFPVLPTAVLIAETGIKGTRAGGAMVSDKHPNFIVNTGNATAEDVKKLIALVKTSVKEKFGVELEEEIIYL